MLVRRGAYLLRAFAQRCCCTCYAVVVMHMDDLAHLLVRVFGVLYQMSPCGGLELPSTFRALCIVDFSLTKKHTFVAVISY